MNPPGDMLPMSSNRPYLLRATYDWIVDNQLTPYLLIEATMSGVRVPSAAVRNGQIVLNIAMTAVADLELGNEWVRFNARFSGVSQRIEVPVPAVLAIYAHENGQGMMFGAEAISDADPPLSVPGGETSGEPGGETSGEPDLQPDPPPRRKAPALRVVK